MKMRSLAKCLLAAALALSWAGPLCAMPAAAEPTHACCPGGEAPASEPMDGACCRVTAAVPPAAPVTPAPAAPAVLPVAAPAAALPAPVFAGRRADVAVLPPSAPPGASSGLSPPASGL